MADYLAMNFNLDTPPLLGTPHPDSHLPRTLLQVDEAKYEVMEMNLGDALVGSYDIDPEGIIWVSEKISGILGRFDPETLSYSRIHIPPVNVTEEFFGGVAVDPEGKVWFSSNVVPNAQWFQYDPGNDEIINTYDVPLPTRPGGDIYFNSFAFPENGSIWSVVTAFHKVYKLDPKTRAIKEFFMREGQHPFGMTIAGDGNIWYAGDNDSILVRIDPDTDELTSFPLNPNTGPRRLATDAQGNLWTAAIDRSALVKMDYRTGEVTEFTPPSAHIMQGLPIVEKYLQGVDVDKARNLIWFSEYESLKLARFDPATNTFLEFPLATAESQPWIVKIDPKNSNRVWWNSRNGRIGYLEFLQ
jgi:virginiamycin B lyase